MDRRQFIASSALAGAATAALGTRAIAQTASYTVRLDIPKQVLWGLGVEIQSDSIGSGNDGLPAATTSVPHDLVPSERSRLATDMIGRGFGFRYIRLAGGLYLRGTRNGDRNLDERFPGQLAELASLVTASGVEGVDLEFWSPTPYWKSTNSYIGGRLKQFDAAFLSDFGDAVAEDIRYLNANGIPVVGFNLQNEAPHDAVLPYSHCYYNNDQYVVTYNAVAAKVRAAHPGVRLTANSWDGQIRSDLRSGLNPTLVDGWTWHRIGKNSNEQITYANRYSGNAGGKPVYNNEFEYLDGKTSEWRMMNTAQSIMNWFVFVDSPTWYWLHVLKPTYNSEAQGYALGYWRPQDDDDFSKYGNIQKGHFDYELRNWRALVGFLEWMPWDSQRYQVDEPTVLNDQRILAFRQGGPSGKLVIVVTNRGSAPFTFSIDTGLSSAFKGYRYSLTQWKQGLASHAGPSINCTVPTNAIEFWVQQ